MRAVLNRETVVRLRVDDEGGALVAAASTPTLAVVNAAGTSVTPGSVTSEATGVYKATIPAQSVVTDLTCTWSYAVAGNARQRVDTIRVTSRPVADLWQFREDAELATVSTTALIFLVDVVQDWLTDALRFPVADEYFDTTFRLGRQTSSMRIPQRPFPREVRSITVDDSAFSATDVADLRVVGNCLERGVTADPFLTGGWSTGRRHAWVPGVYTVTGVHGAPDDWSSVPADLQRAAVILARYISRKNNYPERARAVATDGAQIVLSTPSTDRPTGLPDVDGVVGRYRLTVTV